MTTAPTPDSPLAYASARDLAAWLADGTLTSHDLVTAFLDRVATLHAKDGVDLNAVVALCDDALEQATRLDEDRAAGTLRSALHGVPILIKDNIEVRDLPSSAGSLALDAPAFKDARVVAELRAAGLIILGSTAMSEFASAVYENALDGYSSRWGLTGNPYALDRTPGGSSSGSAAAVAAGCAPLALGTDTMGSACMPASVCGVAALRPTSLVVDQDGVVPYSRRYDRVALMGRDESDVAALYDVLRGLPTSLEAPRALRFAIVTDYEDQRMPLEADAALASLTFDLEEAGFQVRRPEVPNLDNDDWALVAPVLRHDWHRDLPAYVATRDGVSFGSMAELAEEMGARRAQGALLSIGPLRVTEYDPLLSDADADHDADQLDQLATDALTAALDGADVLMGIAYGPAPKLDPFGWPRGLYGSGLDSLAALAGWACLTIPFASMGDLPVGLVIVAPGGDDAVLLRAATIVREHFVPLHDRAHPSFLPPQRG